MRHTATDDNKFRLSQNDLWFRDANIHVETNAAKYGDTLQQEIQISTTDILTFQDFNLSDLFFKNAAAGSNTTITLNGVLMTDGRKKELGV